MYLIYKDKFTLFEDVYIGNTQQKFKKIMDFHFSIVQHIIKKGQNHTYLLPIMINNINMLYHALIYVSILIPKQLIISILSEQ